MSTYFVSPSGNDGNSGTSKSSPWKSIAKVNSVGFNAGDTILFQGGQTFNGRIVAKNGGSSSSAITYGSYDGRATINSGKSEGAYVLNKGGIAFDDLKFQGSPNGKNQNGIRFEVVSGTPSNISVNNCEITGYGFGGILVMGDRSHAGYNNVRLTNNNIHDNVDTGIMSFSGTPYSISNVYIANNQVYSNYGDGSSYVTGNGMMLSGLEGATIEKNVSYMNGWKGGNGGCGIWCYESDHVVFQYNESHHNKALRGHDGDGFDFDEGTKNSIMQFNYSHDNDGNGLQLNNWKNDGNYTNNVVRYNISQNNCQRYNYAGLEAWGKIDNSAFYNNVVVISPAGGDGSGIKVHNSTIGNLFVNNLRFSNNVIIANGGKMLINITGGELRGAKNLTFQGNTYWGGGGTTKFVYGGTYWSLSSWQNATGQEKLNGKNVGLQADPKLVSAGNGGTVNNPGNLVGSLGGYRLQSSSPLINRGLNLSSLFGLGVASHDFFGDPLPQGGAFEVGVDEVGSSQPPPVDTGGGGTGGTGGGTTSGSSLGSGWSSQDIGSVGIGGSSSLSNGVYTVKGSGSDITGSSDGLQYASTTLNGDGQIIAKVLDTGSANSWSKAGVMIRDGSAANGKEVSMLLASNHTGLFERRWAAGMYTGTTDVSASAPEWVKLIRKGNYFSGYLSTDGSNWNLIYTTQVFMNSNVSVGLAVSSHDNSKLDTATFSNVSVVS